MFKNALLCPAPNGRGIKRCFCLTSVCLTSDAYIGPKSRTERPRKTKFGTDSDTTFRVKSQRSPGRFGWLFKSLHNVWTVYATAQSEPLPVDHEYSWSDACRLWTGGGPQRAYSRQSGGIVSPRAQLVMSAITQWQGVLISENLQTAEVIKSFVTVAQRITGVMPRLRR